ncbi:helix-turn-helix domain-containing protein [Thiorhodococcus fuscus]|uniref:Helix-turn-helix domain-containing protein n=1 Tax=Thiorhodococcus fuscus TaxID=527200 RepID=A0ABW4Y7Z6_9GAMM
MIRLAVALLDEDESEIRLDHLPEDLFGPHHREESIGERPQADGTRSHSTSMEASGRSLDEIKHEAIVMAMNEVEGNVSAAARRLGISRNTLYRRIGRMK